MMRIAVFADVHGNSLALEAVLEAMAEIRADLVLNLGDSFSGAVDPAATAAMLRSRPKFVTVRGNHDRTLSSRPAHELVGVDRIAAAAISERDREWLASLDAVHAPRPDVLAFHGSPQDDLCYLLETVEPRGLRQASDEEVITRLGECYGQYRLFVCGHTHLQRSRRLPDGSLVVNPGSVGWPAYANDAPYPHRVEAGTPDARFTVVTGVDGRWTAEHHAIPYDHEQAATIAEQRHARRDIAFALRTGRVRAMS